jgi:electron transport complex protein RnfB
MYLDYRLSTAEQVHERAKASGLSLAEVEKMLKEMTAAGAIARVDKHGLRFFHTVPFVVGMFEYQAGKLDPDFLTDVGAYFRDPSFNRSLVGTAIPQMRTIPVEKSLTPEHSVMHYDALVELLNDSEGPFAVGECICRKISTMRGKSCQMTSRLETCMALGSMATMFDNWREVGREEALKIARLNQAEGLVLQPSNTQKIDFVCACCGCCCGMLATLKSLPRPIDFWATNYCANCDSKLCDGCATCVERCQMEAVTVYDGSQTAHVDLDRCIGCGNCVTTCSTGAMTLVHKGREVVPPVDLQDMYETIGAHKEGARAR